MEILRRRQDGFVLFLEDDLPQTSYDADVEIRLGEGVEAVRLSTTLDRGSAEDLRDSGLFPDGVMPKGSSPTFTRDTLPDAFCSEHALAAKRWGVLQILVGAVTYIDLADGKELELSAPDLAVIGPECPHKLRLHDGELRCRVDFFLEVEGEARLRAKEVAQDDAVRLSFKRCEETADFAGKFYEIFLAYSPDIAPHFANTDFEKQRKLLRASVYVMVTRDVRDPKSRMMLERIGHSHSRRELDIEPKLYEDWLDSLCATVRAIDPEWTEALDKAWRARMRKGMQLITAGY